MAKYQAFEFETLADQAGTKGPYRELMRRPGFSMGIYHLTAVPGIDAVAATHWIWNGTERRKIDIQQLSAVAPDNSPSTSTDDT